MRPRSALATVTIAAALTFALAGCYSGTPSAPTAEESAPPAISVEPATGELIEGTGYTVNAPEGWAVPPDAPPMADLYLIDEDPNANGFINTLNVILGPEPSDTPAEIETNGVAYLEGVVGAAEVQVRPRITIAGSESLHFSGQMSRNAIYWLEQYILIDGGVGYTITFSLRQAMAQADREALAESVLATWTWAPPTTSAGYVYEDADANFAITFLGKPSVAPKDSSGVRATYSATPDPSAPDAVVYAARGTAATGIDILPETLETVVLTLVDQGAVLTAPEVTFELEGMPALMNELTFPTGKDGTFIVAGDGNRIYQLLVIGGTPEERQAFFDSFKLLD